MDVEQLTRQVNTLLGGGRYDEIKPLLLAHKDTTEQDNSLSMLCYLCEVHEKERQAGQSSLFSKARDLDALIDRYTRLKFYLRRIDFGFTDDGLEEFYLFMAAQQISSYELLAAVTYSVVHREEVLKAVKGV